MPRRDAEAALASQRLSAPAQLSENWLCLQAGGLTDGFFPGGSLEKAPPPAAAGLTVGKSAHDPSGNVHCEVHKWASGHLGAPEFTRC